MYKFNWDVIISLVLKFFQILYLAIAVVVVGCGSDKSLSTPLPSGATLITIDGTSVVPSFDGMPTTSVVYVHNNSNVTISGISYTTANNLNSQKAFLDSASILACQSILAGQSCPLKFTTPEISLLDMQGSTVITATYTVKNYNSDQSNTFSQIISYQRVPDLTASGVIFHSGVTLNGAGNSTAYGVLYFYYGGGEQDYTLSNLLVSESAVSILQGNFSNKQLKANSVYDVEVSADVVPRLNESNTAHTNSATNQIDLTKSNQSVTSRAPLSVANLSVYPENSGAVLVGGLVPIIDSSVTNQIGIMYLANLGGTLASLGKIILPNGLTRSSGANDCGATLASGASCTIYFNLPPDGGNGNIVVPYDNSQLVHSITWYGRKTDPLISMNVNADPLSFAVTVGGTAQVTVSNIGGKDLSNVSASAVVSSRNLVITLTKPICKDELNSSTGTNLLIGGSCSYQISLMDDKIETGSIDLSFSGTFVDGSTATYSRILAMNYNSMSTSIELQAVGSD